MIANGHAAVSVSDLDAAVRFYTEALGLRLTNRLGNRWVTLASGPSYWTRDAVNAGLQLGLRAAEPGDPAPGTRGGMNVGLETYLPLESVIDQLSPRGVRFTSEIIRFDAGNCVMFEDQDRNPLYIHEFPPAMLGEEVRDADAPDASVSTSIAGGHAVIYVSDMDRSIRFYTEVLGLPLTCRFEGRWATVEAGRALVIGLHPRTEWSLEPGVRGSITLGLSVDEPIERVMTKLAARGVRVNGAPAAHDEFSVLDPDGNVIVLSARVMAAV